MAKILMVDDRNDNLLMTRVVVERKGHTFFALSASNEAAEAVAQHNPDLILLDYLLPGAVNGVELAHQLREGPAPHTPMILVTASTINDLPDRGKATVFADFLQRPYTNDKLIAMIEAHLS